MAVAVPAPAPRVVARRRRGGVWAKTGLALAFVVGLFGLIYGPVLLLAFFSFNDARIIAFPFEGFTLEWYSQALSDASLRNAIANSLLVTAFVTPVCTVLGLLSAYALTRFRFRGQAPSGATLMIPLMVPWLVTGVAALLFFNKVDIPLSLRTVAVMHVVCTFPLAMLLIGARLMRFNPRLEEAATDLGASRFQTVRLVILPQLYSILAATAIFTFSWSFNNFEISFFTGGFEQTFPVWVFSTLRNSQNLPIVNAISTVIAIVQVLLVVGFWTLVRRGLRRDDARETTDALGFGSGGLGGRT
jgi:spermidine/putrescine transport system permease protein